MTRLVRHTYPWWHTIATMGFLFVAGCQPLEPSGKRPTPSPTPQAKSEDAGEASGILLLSVEKSDSAEGQFYVDEVQPILAESCLTGDCHAIPNDIALQSFPFAIEGSFTEQRVVSEVGPDYVLAEVQDIVVEEIITSMETLYMPRPPLDPVSDEVIDRFRLWLEDDLPVPEPDYVVRITVSPSCTFEVEVRTSLDRMRFELKDCGVVVGLRYEVIDHMGTVVDAGHARIEPDDDVIELDLAL